MVFAKNHDVVFYVKSNLNTMCFIYKTYIFSFKDILCKIKYLKIGKVLSKSKEMIYLMREEILCNIIPFRTSPSWSLSSLSSLCTHNINWKDIDLWQRFIWCYAIHTCVCAIQYRTRIYVYVMKNVIECPCVAVCGWITRTQGY